MTNGWSGAQYTAFRVLLGVYLAVHVARWMPWGAPAVLALLGSLALAIGFRDKLAAVVVIASVVAAMMRGDHREPAFPILAWMLLSHALAVPSAPFGSWDARGRTDPGGGWKMPSWLLVAHRVAFVGAVALVVMGAIPLSFSVGLLFLLTLDPGWMPRRDAAASADLVLYDGACGFCHASIRVLLAEDAEGRSFRFAPLEGEHARAVLSEEQRRAVGDTIVVLTPAGAVLSRSTAVSYIGARLGGSWRIAAALLAAVPAGMRDAGYDAVARVRRRLFAAPKDACPILPPHLRARFQA